MDVWRDLQNKLVLPPETPSSMKNSEALIKDQNPTEIEIQSIELKITGELMNLTWLLLLKMALLCLLKM